MNNLSIVMPHPPRELSPNAHVPLTQRGAIVANKRKMAAKKQVRSMAKLVTLKELNGREFKPTHYEVLWFYKGCKPDADNVLARCKALIDGACAAMKIDDSVLEIKRVVRCNSYKSLAGTATITFYDESKVLTPPF